MISDVSDRNLAQASQKGGVYYIQSVRGVDLDLDVLGSRGQVVRAWVGFVFYRLGAAHLAEVNESHLQQMKVFGYKQYDAPPGYLKVKCPRWHGWLLES